MNYILRVIEIDLRLCHKALLIALFTLSLAISGCGGGSSGSGEQAGAGQGGELVLALTDAEGDFLTYVVDITSIKLHHSNGSVVEALPISTTVDFAQYVELSELLTIATIPAGVYSSVELAIDYSQASVVVQAEDGTPLPASLLDSDGNSLGQMAVKIHLSQDNQVRIAPGIPALVTLDFDLDASNQVTISANEASVVVEPVLLADTLQELSKPFRLRGLLDKVVEEEQVFAIDMRPFRHRHAGFGSVRVHVDSDTRYEIDGVAYDAIEGLAQLAQLAPKTPVVSSGEWSRSRGYYIASSVYAGSSVAWHGNDALRGVVVARQDNHITVHGAIWEFADGRYRFNNNVELMVGANTRVTRQLQEPGDGSIEDISVGSVVTAFGELTDDNTMDASDGRVRVRLSNLTGTVVTAAPLAVDLQLLSARRPALFDFSGTGTDLDSDADRDHYEVDTSSLALTDLNIGEPVVVRGLVNKFGTAPEDFIARTVIDVSAIKAHMVVNYGRDGSDVALSQVSADGLIFDLTDAVLRSVVIRAGIVTQLAAFETPPVVVSAGDTGIYAITRRGRVEIYRQFSDFVTALDEDLVAGERVTRFDANGYFADSQVQLSSRRMRVGLTH